MIARILLRYGWLYLLMAGMNLGFGVANLLLSHTWWGLLNLAIATFMLAALLRNRRQQIP